MENQADVFQELKSKFAEAVLGQQPTRDEVPTVWLAKDHAHEVVHYLKQDAPQPYRMLYDLTAIDERMRVHRDGQPASDFTVVYHLLSFDRNSDVRLNVPLQGAPPKLPTITGLWEAANWYEREVWDMFGIIFDGHPHLQRILMPVTWHGHPLRKEHPARATELGPFQLPEDKQEQEQAALQFRPEEWGLQRHDEDTDFMFLNLAPPHPGTPGVLRIVLQLEGDELVLELELDAAGWPDGPTSDPGHLG